LLVGAAIHAKCVSARWCFTSSSLTSASLADAPSVGRQHVEQKALLGAPEIARAQCLELHLEVVAKPGEQLPRSSGASIVRSRCSGVSARMSVSACRSSASNTRVPA